MNNIPCRYFQTPGGCRFGEMCRFSHSKASVVASCRFYASVGGCRYGKNCFYKHDIPPSSNIGSNIRSIGSSEIIESDEPKPDDQDELIIFGFIRDLIKKKLNEIPIEIMKLCQEFYSIIIKWDISNKWHNNNMRIIDNGNCIKMQDGNNWGSAFLTEEYLSGHHHWKFKIESLDSRRKYYVLFGIWKTKSGEPILDRYFTDKKHNGYAMNAIDGTLTDPVTPGCGGIKYATYCKKGDIIDMYCDFNNLLLSFAINGKYYQNGQKIEKTIYKVAVTMYWKNDTIRFISHDQKPFIAQ